MSATHSPRASKWTCSLCPTENDSRISKCDFCEAPRPHSTPNFSSRPKIASTAPANSPPLLSWQCKSCTLNNPFRTDRCEACSEPRFDSQRTSHSTTLSRSSSSLLSPPLKQSKYIEVDDVWHCRFCTCQNAASNDECVACETPRKSRAPKAGSSSSISRSASPSPGAIYISIDDDDKNDSNMRIDEPRDHENESGAFSDMLKGAILQCGVCGCEFDSEDMDSLLEHAALHMGRPASSLSITSSSSSNSKRPSQSDKVLDTSHFATAYERQYARHYSRAVKNFRTAQQIQDRLSALSRDLMIAPDTETCDTQVIGALRTHYENFGQHSRNFVLATKVSHFHSGHGDRGWGCGYRNIQMMCSSLSQYPHFRRSLFGGVGYIPTIPVLQQCLEAAWADGFDTSKDHNKKHVFGGNAWIGTYDAVAMLRHFGVPMELQTFHAAERNSDGSANRPQFGGNGHRNKAASSSSSNSSSPFHIVSTTLSNLASSVAAPFKYTRYQQAKYVPHTQMFKWVWDYFSTRKARGDAIIPPLYLQHDGHSRTIVGAENSNGRIALLIFDPSFQPRDVSQKLLSQPTVPDILRKTLSEFRHQNYQIAYLKDGSSPIAQARRNEFKTIRQGSAIVSS